MKKPTLPYDYFHKEIATRLVERLDDINIREEGFPLALDVGSGSGHVHDAICTDFDDMYFGLENDDDYYEDGRGEKPFVGGRGGVRKLVQMDSSSSLLHRDDAFYSMLQEADCNLGDESASSSSSASNSTKACETYKLVADEEEPFPFPDGTFDLVISSMAFHWVNDLPKLLTEIKVRYLGRVGRFAVDYVIHMM